MACFVHVQQCHICQHLNLLHITVVRRTVQRSHDDCMSDAWVQPVGIVVGIDTWYLVTAAMMTLASAS
jgi:hypothetical protein